jgi:hypothetical protein
MSYSDSLHFSDKISYKIHFILRYGLRDMDLARFKQIQQFSENEISRGLFSPSKQPSRETDGRDRPVLTRLGSRGGADSD